MIYLRMRGGRLGNQMFQYAFARMLKEANPGEEIRFNYDDVIAQHVKEGDGYENSLRYFNVEDSGKLFTISKVLTIPQKALLKVYAFFYPHVNNSQMDVKAVYELKWCRILALFGIYRNDYGCFQFPFKKKKYLRNLYLYGTFESDKYFSPIRNILLKEFTPKLPILERNGALYKIIEKTNSVAISIRRGDFLSISAHNVCTKNYFERAILKAKEDIPNPVFFFFSDDIDWVKKNVRVENDCYYESGNDPVWETLRLMYSCKHFIISNSTFNWWAQYLGRYPEKKVYAPKKWYNSNYIPDIFQSNWTLIDVE